MANTINPLNAMPNPTAHAAKPHIFHDHKDEVAARRVT